MKVAVMISFFAALISSVVAWMPSLTTSQQIAAQQVGSLLNANDEEVNPEAVTFLQVARWDNAEDEADVFAVQFKDGAWIIPSHFDYPADGGDRVGETAGNVLNVPRGPLVTNDAVKHAEFSLRDPLQTELSGSSDGYGQRYTLKDTSGATVVDIIVGNIVEGTDVRYVRNAGDDAVYTAKIVSNISTAFRDWVKTDLFEIAKDDLRRIIIKDYSINEQSGQIDVRSEHALLMPEDSDTWKLTTAPAGKQLVSATMTSLSNELTSLRLVGVRPFDQTWLQQRGFYFDNQGKLYGNEGELLVQTTNGVFYNCFFGEIALGDDQDTAADVSVTDTATAASGSNRYMVVVVGYDENADEQHKALVAERDRIAALNAAADSGTAQLPVPEVPEVPAGKELSAQEQQRFAKYFYVIADASFGFLRPDEGALLEDVVIEPADSETVDFTPKSSSL